jgi:hypothetical protein
VEGFVVLAIAIAALVLIGVAAVAFGTDSRDFDPQQQPLAS